MPQNNKGFTLVELILVIAILAIVAMLVMPNVPQILQRQRVKADIITAQQIGSSVRMWYIENKYDNLAEIEAGKKSVTDFEANLPEDDEIVPIKYFELSGMDKVIPMSSPTSLSPNGRKAENPYYGVYLNTTGYIAKIVVTIQDENSATLRFGTGEGEIPADKVMYDGTAAGIAYIE